jgi:hypothetical protein
MKIKTLDIFNGEKQEEKIVMDYLIDCSGEVIYINKTINIKDLVKLNYRSGVYDFYIYQKENGEHIIYLEKK